MQERRYAQLAGRVDQLGDHMQAVSPNSGSSVEPLRNRRLLIDAAALEELNERLQRAERRILGRLADGLLALDERNRIYDELSDPNPIDSKEAKR
ncbi:hypothetical protein GCM10022249_01720 [Enteractinococcus coprophilus]